MTRLFSIVFLVAAFGAASAAQAGTVRTTFDISDTSLIVFNDFADIPISDGNNGQISGTFKSLSPTSGSGLTSAVDGIGAVTTVDLDIVVSVDMNVILSHLLIDGTVNSDQVGWALGTFDRIGNDAQVLGPAGNLVLRTATHLTCTDVGLIPACGIAGDFPIDSTATQPGTVTLSFLMKNIATVGAASFTYTFLTDIATPSATESQLAQVTLVGKEIAREVPEPGSLALLGAGVLGLAGLAGVGRLRRRS